jgi:hypothetical protein
LIGGIILTCRKVRIRFKVLRNGVEYAELYAKGKPSLRMSRSADIKMSMQGIFLPTATDVNGNVIDINWFIDEIQPALIIDGVEYPLAVLMPASVTPSKKSTGTEVSVQAYDRCWRVSDAKTESVLHFNAGTNYLSAIESLLTQAGIATITKTPTSATIQEDREDWGMGTPYLTIVNQLLSEINYESLWFNARGVAVLQPMQGLVIDNVKRVYTNKYVDPREPNAIQINNIMPEITQTNDIFRSPNVFVCICSNADKTGDMVATSVNTNPQSPLSTKSRGRRIVQVVRVDNIASQTALQGYADKLRNESMITGETYNFSTMLIPECGVAGITAFQSDDINAICVEEEWRMELGIGGKMNHTLKKVVINVG